MKKLAILLMVVVFAITASGSALAQSTKNDEHKVDLSKPKATVERIRQPDPPQVSTTTKPSPVGQKASDYHPPAANTMKSIDKAVVPPPSK